MQLYSFMSEQKAYLVLHFNEGQLPYYGKITYFFKEVTDCLLWGLSEFEIHEN